MARIDTIYFVGPSLYGGGLPSPLKGELWLGPARQGDVLVAYLKYCPRTVVLIDGYLRRDFPTWHKELCYIMVDGCRFIGASSIGALRAAELWRYGAIGIGTIFEAYRDGKTEDEAWVMLEFHPKTFQPLSEPLCTNQLKRSDALAAVEYARTVKTKPKCGLTKKCLGIGLQITLDRILADDYLLTHEHGG
jgi:hypothetical protein